MSDAVLTQSHHPGASESEQSKDIEQHSGDLPLQACPNSHPSPNRMKAACLISHIPHLLNVPKKKPLEDSSAWPTPTAARIFSELSHTFGNHKANSLCDTSKA